MISFNEFKKMELKTARVEQAEEVEGKEKLLKLSLDLGTEKKQTVAGIKPFYPKEELVGRTVIVVANLEPTVIAGIKSETMLLAAKNAEGGYSLLSIDGEVKPGTAVE